MGFSPESRNITDDVRLERLGDDISFSLYLVLGRGGAVPELVLLPFVQSRDELFLGDSTVSSYGIRILVYRRSFV